MISITLNRDRLRKWSVAKKKQIADTADKQYRQNVLAVFKDGLEVSAQWSGDYVKNFHITKAIGGDLKAYVDHGGEERVGQVHQAGDPEAVNFALTRAKFQQFGYKDKVIMYNPAPLEFTGTTATRATCGRRTLFRAACA
jgi:hypothetical protein